MHSTTLCSALLFALVFSVGAADLPNFVMLYADDMGYGDVGVFGSPTILTPNIDRMAYEGLKLTNFYTAYPICSPSRASLLTGRVPIRTGVYTNTTYPEDLVLRVFLPQSTGGLSPHEITIARLLKTKGYTSKIIGKWHLGHYNNSLPTENGGFDSFYGLPYSQDEGCPPGYGNPCSWWQKDVLRVPVPLYEDTKIIQQPVNLDTLMDRYNDQAVSFIKSSVAAKKPFFLYYAYDEVHVPLFASKQWRNKSRRGLFGDATMEMDASIGLILDLLKDLKVDDNTFVFFSSDNGPWLDQKQNAGSAGPFKGGKGSTYEGGLREPAIAWWPGKIKPMSVSPVPTTTMDLLPTWCELAGVPLPSDRIIDGHSITSTLFGTQEPADRPLIFYRGKNVYAIRHGAYKAHFFTRSGFGVDAPVAHNPPLLFNLDNDPGEAYPLEGPEYADIIATIKAAKAKHEASVKVVPAQLDALSGAEDVEPCCYGTVFPACTCNVPF